jgi:hypothetical protein
MIYGILLALFSITLQTITNNAQMTIPIIPPPSTLRKFFHSPRPFHLHFDHSDIHKNAPVSTDILDARSGSGVDDFHIHTKPLHILGQDLRCAVIQNKSLVI